MKTIYLNGLMVERCQVFTEALARRFIVVAPGLRYDANNPDLHLVDARAETGQIGPAARRDFVQRVVEQSAVLAGSLASDLVAADVGFSTDWQVPEEFINSEILPKVERLQTAETVFQDFHARQPVDLVISGSDYGSNARPVALAARELGIPTLNIEHGFFFTRCDPDLNEHKSVLPTRFVSEYANFDNALEVESFSKEAQDDPRGGTTFMTLGTPVATAVPICPGRAEAVAALGLAAEKKIVLLFGSWIESRAINNLVQGQIDTIDAYEDLLRSLAATGLAGDVELLIKLHPVEAHPDVFPGVKAALETMASTMGLPAPRVYCDQLPELFGASDVVVTMGFSSLLFDAFQLGKPTIVRVMPYLTPGTTKDWRTEMNAPLREGVITAVESGDAVWSQVQSYLEPGGQEKLAAARERLCNKYELRAPSVEDKSAAIIQWIAELLAD